MTDPLTLDRFRELANAYGGVVARWPESDREAASHLAATSVGVTILQRASQLDARLDEWKVAAPTSDLLSRVVAHAPVVPGDSRSRPRWWWSGIGIAATLAGAVAGSAAVAMVGPVDIGTSSTSFGDLAGTDS